MGIIQTLQNFIKSSLEPSAQAEARRPYTAPAPEVVPPGLPPSTYGVTESAETPGKFVVTVDNIATMVPRWPTYEAARIDAWERWRGAYWREVVTPSSDR